jgi:uncharacterized protein
MKPSDALRANRTKLREMAIRHGVGKPRIFGSVANGTDSEGSDLDLLVDPTESTTLLRLSALQLEAERLLGVHVDVLTPKSLPASFRDRVLAEAVAL